MRLKSIKVLGLFGLVLCSLFLTSNVDAATKPLVLIVAGQSNAGGFGTTGNDVPLNLQAAQSNVLYWRDTSTSGAPVYGFQTYQAGVNSDPSARTSPEKWGPEAE